MYIVLNENYLNVQNNKFYCIISSLSKIFLKILILAKYIFMALILQILIYFFKEWRQLNFFLLLSVLSLLFFKNKLLILYYWFKNLKI